MLGHLLAEVWRVLLAGLELQDVHGRGGENEETKTAWDEERWREEKGDARVMGDKRKSRRKWRKRERKRDEMRD